MANFNVELIRESRGIEVGRQRASQEITLRLCIDPDIGPLYPDAEFMGFKDDIQALEYAYTLFPEIKRIPDYSYATSGNEAVIILDSIKLEEVNKWDWTATASYVYNQNAGAGGDRGGGAPDDSKRLPYLKIGFNIGGGTKKITQSLQIVDPPSLRGDSPLASAPDNEHNIIGFTEDGGVEGTEVPDSTFRLSITAYYYPSTVTMEFAMQIKDLIAGGRNTGSYNHEEYMGRPAGEISLLSASGGGTIVDIIPITFEFSVAKNIDDVTDPKFDNLTMLGHDVLDYTYISRTDILSKKILLYPEWRTVHRVRTPEDYTKLLIPV